MELKVRVVMVVNTGSKKPVFDCDANEGIVLTNPCIVLPRMTSPEGQNSPQTTIPEPYYKIQANSTIQTTMSKSMSHSIARKCKTYSPSESLTLKDVKKVSF